MVQAKILLPKPTPVSGLAGFVGEEMAAAPEISVQLPVPAAGVFPASVTVKAQMV